MLFSLIFTVAVALGIFCRHIIAFRYPNEQENLCFAHRLVFLKCQFNTL